MASLYYDGSELDVPINHEYEHSGNMTILNDAHGYIYSAFSEFLLSNSSNRLANSGYTMVIKCLSGDAKKKWRGSVITMRGVRFEWKKDGTPAIGTIAQEVQNTYPELTKTYRNFEGEERLTVNYSGLVGVLIEAVKELSGKVKELSQEIEQLKHNEDR